MQACWPRLHRSPRAVCSPLSVGRHAGGWCPFDRGNDQADDQRGGDALSLAFETPPLAETVEILGAPVVTLEVASDKAGRTADREIVQRASRREVAAGELRRAEPYPPRRVRRAHEPRAGAALSPCVQLNGAGAGFPAGHPDPAGILDGLLADGVTRTRGGDGDDHGRRARACRCGRCGPAGSSRRCRRRVGAARQGAAGPAGRGALRSHPGSRSAARAASARKSGATIRSAPPPACTAT